VASYLLWDHDGVLVDTERWYFEATRTALSRLEIELSEKRYLELMAVGRSCWELASAAGVSDDDIRAGRAARDELYQELLQTKPIEIEGVEQVLAELADRHRMAIVTTAKRRDFDLIHSNRRLLRHFEFALTVEDYARSKPSPDPYLAGLARFGARPEEALALEDSARGLGSARAAGLRCVVIRSQFTASQDFAGAWRLVDSIRDVPGLLEGLRGHTPPG